MFWKLLLFLHFFLFIFLNQSCNNISNNNDIDKIKSTKDKDKYFYYGADLSYVNEMEDCGVSYKNVQNMPTDVYDIFKNTGVNLVRVRLWHNPSWTNYSTITDVKKTIKRAKKINASVLLDFHYSDTWADPQKQDIPAAWENVLDNTELLGDSMYNYTYNVLNKLAKENLLPDIVQIGNEINAMILQKGELKWPIDWKRNAYLINRGIKAVRDVAEKEGKRLEIMLHIAQLENAIWWFKDAKINGISDFDWIGISYYPKWSKYDLNTISKEIEKLIDTYQKKLMIVETAYPFTLKNVDAANNILGEDALLKNYSATQQGQLAYLQKLKQVVKDAGGEGVVYWEPAWVSNSCSTKWGQGSHWDNATLFDYSLKPTLGMKFYNH